MSEQINYDVSIPSQRVRFALEALKEYEQKDWFRVDMDDFHCFDDDTGECLGCIAGCAALKRWSIKDELLESIHKEASAHNRIAKEANISFEEVLFFENSLDNARVGNIGPMFRYMRLPGEAGEKFNREITDYHADRDQFLSDMQKLADDLEEAGW